MKYGFYIKHGLPEYGLAPVVIGWAGTEQLAERFISTFSDADKRNITIEKVTV